MQYFVTERDVWSAKSLSFLHIFSDGNPVKHVLAQPNLLTSRIISAIFGKKLS